MPHISSGLSVNRIRARTPYLPLRNRKAPYRPAMAIVTSSIVITSRLTTASGVGGARMKCNPKN